MNHSPTENERRHRVVTEAFRCRRALEVYAYSLLKDRTEAEDPVQEAFIVVMEKFADFEEGTSMMAWTRAIVRLKVLQSLDKKNRRAKLVDKLLVDTVDAAFEEVETRKYAEDTRERYRGLEACLSKLGERPRRILECIYTERMSYDAAALKIGMGREAVKKSLQRTKAKLRECLQRNRTEEAI
ncbi:MAG: sigma-70 family RNA polymerase sigma factor [Akkermansiaceae bacterium]|nr:sigma-70 family RNA polymerase sigma factor [Akkermansiaceae bacterium]